MTQQANTVGQPVRTQPMPAMPPRFDGKELEYLTEALKSNTLFYRRKDGFVERMLARACAELGSRHAVATSSGTAALHVALGAVGAEPGSEVITAPITDMGTAIAILYQNCIPVFADLDDRSYTMTAETIEAQITERTRAVLVIHLTGAPCDMEPIVQLCKSRRIALIEDAAQSYGCWYRGKHVGRWGDIGCFSLNDYKHLGTGDGGFVITDDEALYKRAHNYADKCYDRLGQGNRLSMLCPNYRMSELQGAVGLAQWDRFKSITEKRRELGDYLSAQLEDISGILPPRVVKGGQASYWFYMFRVEPAVLGMSRADFVQRLGALGIGAGSGYIGRLLCHEPVFVNKAFFPGGIWPAEVIAKKSYNYGAVKLPGAQRILESAVTLGVHQGMSKTDIDDYVKAIRRAAGRE